VQCRGRSRRGGNAWVLASHLRNVHARTPETLSPEKTAIHSRGVGEDHAGNIDRRGMMDNAMKPTLLDLLLSPLLLCHTKKNFHKSAALERNEGWPRRSCACIPQGLARPAVGHHGHCQMHPFGEPDAGDAGGRRGGRMILARLLLHLALIAFSL
jgi:hypothetical protein